jgi:hypothetical protein
MTETTEDVKRAFSEEFSAVLDKFCVLELPVDDVKKSTEECVYHPGVYVWLHPDRGVLKVGRHFTNSRKRALEHIRDNTGGVMRAYGEKSETKLLLFNVRDPDAYHWVAAVEVFLERVGKPYVVSKRQG